MRNAYEEEFNRKVELLKDHEKFEVLDRSRKEALSLHTGFGHDAIAAADFMDRIIAMPVEYISEWLYGKNRLEWTPEYIAQLSDIKQNGYRPLKENN